MHVLAIDIGNYSVKYISTFVERRKIVHTEMSETIISDYMTEHADLSFRDAQISIAKEIIENTARPESRIIFQADNEQMTTRFLTLPVKSKKKAELMLPFQLEEDIPFSLSEIQYGHRLESAKSQHHALVSLVRESIFSDYFNLLKMRNAIPTILTSEASVVENYFNQNALAGTFCVLDFGHKTTKAYFFYNSRLIVSHVCYVAGRDVNDMISRTYNIDADEAVFYKHQNAFVLTSLQYDEVNANQRDFALNMDNTLSPLVTDFLRWKIGLKVNYGLSLQHIFLTGGSSNIKNITHYLTEKWDTKVVLLETFEKVETNKIDLNPKSKSKYALANMMTIGMKRKNRFINLLNGKYAQSSGSELPLHSFAFLGIRVASVALLILISLFIERFFIQKDIQLVNAKISSMMKNDVLAINGRLRRTFATNPKPVYDALVKRQRTIRQEISTVQSAMGIRALSPLVQISQLAASTKATLTELKVSDIDEISAVFTAENEADLMNLKSQLERATFADLNLDMNKEKLQLRLSATGQ